MWDSSQSLNENKEGALAPALSIADLQTQPLLHLLGLGREEGDSGILDLSSGVAVYKINLRKQLIKEISTQAKIGENPKKIEIE